MPNGAQLKIHWTVQCFIRLSWIVNSHRNPHHMKVYSCEYSKTISRWAQESFRLFFPVTTHATHFLYELFITKNVTFSQGWLYPSVDSISIKLVLYAPFLSALSLSSNMRRFLFSSIVSRWCLTAYPNVFLLLLHLFSDNLIPLLVDFITLSSRLVS